MSVYHPFSRSFAVLSDFLIYEGPDKAVQIEVRLDGETLWLNQQQLSELLETDRTSVSRHIKNVLSSGELDTSTCVFFAQVRLEGKRRITREIEHYNLDMILSVAYRVNSRRGTQFRQWANQRIKEYLIDGYSLNISHIRRFPELWSKMSKAVELIDSAKRQQKLGQRELEGFVDIVARYSRSLDLLVKFENRNLSYGELTPVSAVNIEISEVREVIEKLRSTIKASGQFGKERDGKFERILDRIFHKGISKTFVISVEEQSAELLYSVIKESPFVDGNKRISSFLFIWILEKNKLRFDKSGEVKINANGLVALTLLVDMSLHEDKSLMIELIKNLIA